MKVDIEVVKEADKYLQKYMKALQAVVELHNPVEGVWVYECGHCNIWDDASEYPCATIQAIEKVLND